MSLFLSWLELIMPVALIIGTAVYFSYRGKPQQVILLEYQRGILYRRGVAVRDVGPGRYWVWAGTELLLRADMRPMSINYQNLVVSLQDGASAVYSFTASAQAKDIRKAIYAARNYEHIPHSVLRCCTRLALNQRTGQELRAGLDGAVQEITRNVKARLGEAGFELMSFRMTQMSVAVPNATVRVPANPQVVS